MPRLDLRDMQGKLHPLAPFKVLAVMCHPNDRAAQRKMVALIEAQTGEGLAKRPGITPTEFLAQVERASHRGNIAGDLLLYLIQLQTHHPPGTVNKALALTHAALPPWNQPENTEWHDRLGEVRSPTHRARMLRSFRDYRPVAHLWGALILGQIDPPAGIWPGSNETIPAFLAVAANLAAKGRRILWRGRGQRWLLKPRENWTFTVPDQMRRTCGMDVPPLGDQHLQALSTLKNI